MMESHGKMNVGKLTLESRYLLSLCGWSRDAIHDCTEDCRLLRSAGYECGPSVEYVLTHYSGLLVEPSKLPRRYEFTRVAIGVDASFVEDAKLDPDVVTQYDEQAGERLTLIGEIDFERNDIRVGESGMIYAAWDVLIWKLGDSIEDMLNGVFEGRAVGPEIPPLVPRHNDPELISPEAPPGRSGLIGGTPSELRWRYPSSEPVEPLRFPAPSLPAVRVSTAPRRGCNPFGSWLK